MFDSLFARWIVAATTLPSFTDWFSSASWVLIYGTIVIPIGLWKRLLIWEPVIQWQVALSAGIIAFFVPSLLEESIFRVLLLPSPTSTSTVYQLWGWGTLSLVLFIAAHPINAAIYLRAARPTFFDPLFLAFAGLLGLLCSWVYWQTGSLWVPTVLHWAIVVIWLLLLGGLAENFVGQSSCARPSSLNSDLLPILSKGLARLPL